MIETFEQSPEQSEDYYDFLNRKVILVGRTAITGRGQAEDYLMDLYDHGKIELRESRPDPLGRPGEFLGIQPVNYLLAATDLPATDKSEHYDISHWQLNHYRSYGFWLDSQVKCLNSLAIRNASMLCIGASPKQIKHEKIFGSLSNFYVESNLRNTKRNAAFRDWTRQDFVDYIKTIAKYKGRRPHVRELHKLSQKNPAYPSPEVIAPRFGRQHSLGLVMELAGFTDTRSWSEEDYLNWGVRFMFANEGRRPSANHMDYLCKTKSGPSRHSVRRKFKKISFYQRSVEKMYSIESQLRAQGLEVIREEIKYRATSTRDLPLLLLRGIGSEGDINDDTLFSANGLSYDDIEGEISEKEKIQRYSKFKVLEELTNLSASVPVLLKVCITGLNGRGFESSVKKLNDAISAADIEETASYLGVYDYIWPMDNYMETLRIPDYMLSNTA